ncbi:MAG TPA: hypothetical protein PLS49_05295, partial [Candidatus Woesebacteria bacterium]|nr:hypothetical protein [Candidatus Woesebacteria bacterium]
AVITTDGNTLEHIGLKDKLIEVYAAVFSKWNDPAYRATNRVELLMAKKEYLEWQGTFEPDRMLVSIMLGTERTDILNPASKEPADLERIYAFAITDMYPSAREDVFYKIGSSIERIYPCIDRDVIDRITLQLKTLGEEIELPPTMLLFNDLGADSNSMREDYGILRKPPSLISKQIYRLSTLELMKQHLDKLYDINSEAGNEVELVFWTIEKSPLSKIASVREQFKPLLTLQPTQEADDKPKISIFHISLRELRSMLNTNSNYYNKASLGVGVTNYLYY